MIFDDEVAPLFGLLRVGHPQPREAVLAFRLRGPALLDGQLLAVYGRHAPHPAREGLLEGKAYIMDKIISVAFEEWVGFLFSPSVSMLPFLPFTLEVKVECVCGN